MAIKSKKWKQIVSFGTFVLGVSLLVTGGGRVLDRCFGYGRPERLEEVFEQDYQNTGEFRWQMENDFSTFLAMATGGYPGGTYTYNGNYVDYGYASYEDYLAMFEDQGYAENVREEAAESGTALWGRESTVIKEAVDVPGWGETAGDAEWEESVDDGSDGDYAGRRLTDGMDETERRERNEAAAKRYHESICEDRNLLYRISYDGKELYSNMDGISWQKEGDALPDGYNFLFSFDGQQVRITKDGNEPDIYGDGYYRGEAGQWYVPGYRNFTVDDEMKKAQIVMLVAEEPADYVYVRYGKEGYARYGSALYSVAQSVGQRYRGMQAGMTALAAGVVLLLVSLLGRKSRKEIRASVGAFCGKIWFEVKALLLLLLAWSVFLPLLNQFGYEYAYVYADLMYEWGSGYTITEFSREVLRDMINVIFARPLLLLALVWGIYFLIVDVRANGKKFFSGGISRLMRRFETRSLSLPYTKRMIVRFLLVMLVSLLLIAAEFALVCSVVSNGQLAYFVWDYGGVAVILFLIPVVLFFAACWYYLVRTRAQAEELELMAERIRSIHDGDYGKAEDLAACVELKEMAEDLGGIRAGMEKAVEERMKSERMKVELVANVSHDIRTPLTSIISYVQFLKQEEGLPDHVKDYISILDEKSRRLNNMVQDVFAISKAASDQLPVKLERIDFGKLLRQTLADMDEQIRKSPVTVKAVIPEHEIAIQSDGSRMYRVFQNLIQNALQYSLEGSRVFIELREDASFAVACIKNVSSQELARGADFTERFVRGDESRTDGGSGLGLSIAKSFTEACGGRFEVETNADLFVVTVSFVRV